MDPSNYYSCQEKSTLENWADIKISWITIKIDKISSFQQQFIFIPQLNLPNSFFLMSTKWKGPNRQTHPTHLHSLTWDCFLQLWPSDSSPLSLISQPQLQHSTLHLASWQVLMYLPPQTVPQARQKQGETARRQRGKDRDMRPDTFKDFVYTIEFIEVISSPSCWKVLVSAGAVPERAVNEWKCH